MNFFSKISTSVVLQINNVKISNIEDFLVYMTKVKKFNFLVWWNYFKCVKYKTYKFTLSISYLNKDFCILKTSLSSIRKFHNYKIIKSNLQLNNHFTWVEYYIKYLIKESFSLVAKNTTHCVFFLIVEQTKCNVSCFQEQTVLQ